ncbi:MAG: GGDEF domain-containing protein [Actinomycetota bacterium]
MKKLVQALRKSMTEDKSNDVWDADTERLAESLYAGMLACVEDELYLQEFLPYGSMYRLAGEHGVRRRNRNVPIESVMQEHIAIRDVFWEYRRTRSEKVHDFAVEKRVLQCFNGVLQATVQAYQTREPTMDVLDPLRDPLTGVFNSLYFQTRLEEEVKRSERYLRDVTVMLMHVDSVFDPGSEEEAELMRAVARVLRRNSRASDILARLEANQFAVLMPETRSEHAEQAAERLKSQVAEYLPGMGEGFTEISIEVGLAAYPEHGEDGAVLLQEASESITREDSGGD